MPYIDLAMVRSKMTENRDFPSAQIPVVRTTLKLAAVHPPMMVRPWRFGDCGWRVVDGFQARQVVDDRAFQAFQNIDEQEMH
jgi:hypothetical protein